ncbi:polymeric immunoglobulin receptor [Anableps anableps]
MLQLSTITLFLLPWIPAFLCKVTTEEEFTILEGDSLTIPCHYEPQYASYVKYWCQGSTREFCTTLARTDDHDLTDPAKERVSIFDDPVQLVFTVTMNNMKEGESGWYMCGVEIGGMWTADDIAFTNIKVIHGMSIVNNRISGEEGSTVTIECLYSERYRENEKKWCRSGDPRSCLTTGSDGSYEDSSMAIRDDRTRAFTVTFKKLQMKDTAWYWCSTGHSKEAVHLLVTPQPTTIPPVTNQSIPNLPPAKPITRESWSSHSPMLASVVVCSSVIFLAVVAILVIKFWKLHKSDRVPREVEEMKAKFSGYSRDADDLACVRLLFNEDVSPGCIMVPGNLGDSPNALPCGRVRARRDSIDDGNRVALLELLRSLPVRAALRSAHISLCDIRLLRDDGKDAATVTVRDEGQVVVLEYHLHQGHNGNASFLCLHMEYTMR